MPALKYWDSNMGQYVPLSWAAIGPTGPTGPAGPAGGEQALDDLTDVVAPATTPAGKLLGTTAEGAWGAVDAPTGEVEEAPIDGTPYMRQDADWVSGQTGAFLPLTGGTMLGPLILDGTEPASGPAAADKDYVDSRIWTGTQAQYDAIGTKDPEVLYVVTG
jgi:hypothetical protein